MREQLLVEELVKNISKDNKGNKKLGEHLIYANNKLTNKFTLDELNEFEINITEAVRKYTDNEKKYVCSGLIVLYESVHIEDILDILY